MFSIFRRMANNANASTSSSDGTNEPSSSSSSSPSSVPLAVLNKSRIKLGWAEKRGKRYDQEDTICLIPSFMNSKDCHLFCVFDGHGGAKTAEFAASHIAPFLADSLRVPPSEMKEINYDPIIFRERVFDAFNSTFRNLQQSLSEQKFDDGATALVVLIDQKYVFVANCGDCRAVLGNKNGTVKQLSLDHKPTDITEFQRVFSAGGFITEELRVNGILAVTRSLGDIQLQPHVTFEPDLSFHVLDRDDSFLILACDGVWDVVSNQRASMLVQESSSPHNAAIRIRDHASSLGSTDNISVVVVSLTHPSFGDVRQSVSGEIKTSSDEGISSLDEHDGNRSPRRLNKLRRPRSKIGR